MYVLLSIEVTSAQ
uniref:Uncharacterized protein n=1 Tax=Lepeophtheirus salmonis TaxID=72036 RepID=A0A0K2UR33_LEPSM